MKNMCLIILCLVTMLFTATVSFAAVTWTDRNGRSIQATFEGFADEAGTRVKLKTSKGKVFTVNVKDLSGENQAFLRKIYTNKQKMKAKSEEETETPVVQTPTVKKKKKKASSSDSTPKVQPVTQDEPDEEDSIEETTISVDSPGTQVVIVEGYGETSAEAKKDALRNAVQEVVGTLVDAKSRVENAELIEEIMTFSNAYVESNQILKMSKEEGLYTVKMRATVVKTAIDEKLNAGKPKTYTVSGQNVLDKMETKEASEKDGVKMLAQFLKDEQFPYALYNLELTGEPEVKKAGDKIEYTCQWETSVDMEKYKAFSKRLCALLDKLAVRKSSYVMEMDILDQTSSTCIPQNWEDINRIHPDWESSFMFCVSTEVDITWTQVQLNCYQLPSKYRAILGVYYCIFPVERIALLDSNRNVISCQNRVVTTNNKWNGYQPFNLVPIILHEQYAHQPCWSWSSVSIDGIESSVCGDCGSNDSGVMILPLCGDGDKRPHSFSFCPELYHSHTFTLSPEELSQVKNITLVMSAENPDMDKIYEELDSRIDAISTDSSR